MSASSGTRRVRAMPNGWWGVLLLTATEAALFATLIASYFYLRFTSAQWPPAGTTEPSSLGPALLTGLLVSTSVPMLLASRAARDGRAGSTRRLLLVALVVQLAYLGLQVSEFLAQLDKHPATENAYSSIFSTLSGVHHAHVLVGALLVAGLLLRIARGLTRYRIVGVRAVALYWHFTNLVAVAVLLTQISPVL